MWSSNKIFKLICGLLETKHFLFWILGKTNLKSWWSSILFLIIFKYSFSVGFFFLNLNKFKLTRIQKVKFIYSLYMLASYASTPVSNKNECVHCTYVSSYMRELVLEKRTFPRLNSAPKNLKYKLKKSMETFFKTT